MYIKKNIRSSPMSVLVLVWFKTAGRKDESSCTLTGSRG